MTRETERIIEAIEALPATIHVWQHGLWGQHQAEEILVVVYIDEDPVIVEEYHNVKSLASAKAIVENPNSTPTLRWKKAEAWLRGQQPDTQCGVL